MLPIRDNAPSRTAAWMIAAIIALNAVVFCVQRWPGIDSGAVVANYGLIPSRFMHWSHLGGSAVDPWRYIPLLSAMFLHDGWIHLATNMVYLWTFGRALEDRLGRGGVCATFFLSGLAAAFGQLIAHPQSNAAMIGASGAIAGLLGAYLVCFPRARITLAFPFYLVPWVLKLRASWFLLGWFALQIVEGVVDLVHATGDPSVAWWAHATGFLTGAIGAVAGRGWVGATDPQPTTAPSVLSPIERLRDTLVEGSLALRASRVPALVRSSMIPTLPPSVAARVSLPPP